MEEEQLEPTPEVRRGRKKRRVRRGRHLSTGTKVALGLLGALAGIVLIAAIALAAAYLSGSANLHGAAQEAADAGDSQTVTYKGDTYRFNENVVSVLVMGLDDESDYADVARKDACCNDANLLVTMDTSTNSVTIIAIPRDSQVNVDLYQDGQLTVTKPLQLCLAYSTDCGSEAACAKNACASVSRIMLGMPVTHYLTLDERALEDASSAMGGVPLKAAETIPGTDIVKGKKMLLEGYDAWMYLHYRDTNVDDSAQDRLARQRQFVSALVTKLRGMGASQMLDVYNAVSDQMGTNLGASEVTYLAGCLVAGNEASTQFITLTGKTELLTDDDGVQREHVFLSDKSVKEAVMAAYYVKASDEG